MNNYALTGASFPLKISGREFAAYSLRDKDYEELSSYIQSKVLAVAMEAIPVTLSPTSRAEWQQSAIRAAASSGWGTQEGIRIMNTTEGYWRLGWQMTKKDSAIGFFDFVSLAETKGKDEIVNNLTEIDKVFIVLHSDPLDEPTEASGEPEEGSSNSPKSE